MKFAQLFLAIGFLGLGQVTHAASSDALNAYLEDRATTLHAAFENSREYLRFQIASDPAIHAVAIYDGSGSGVFPPTDAAQTLQEEAASQDIAFMNDLRQSSGPSVLLHPVQTDRLFFCDDTVPLCLTTFVGAVAADLSVSENDLRQALVSSPSTHRPWTIAALALVLLAVVLLIFRTKRGTQRRTDPTGFQIADLKVSPKRMTATRGTLEIALTPRDLALLTHLHDRHGEVVSRDDLYDAGWGRDFMPNSRALDQHIITLRRKLDPDRSRAPLIETVRAAGYRVVED